MDGEELIDALEGRGCKVREAIEGTFMGDAGFYLRMLRKLPQSKCFSRLEAAMATGVVRDVFESAHELKGLYANLGLTPLCALASEITEIARAGHVDGAPGKFEKLGGLHAECLALLA